MNCAKCNQKMDAIVLSVSGGSIVLVDRCPECHWEGNEYTYTFETFDEYMSLKEEIGS